MLTLKKNIYLAMVILVSFVFAALVDVVSTAYALSLDASGSTDALKIQTGTTAERPTGENGMIRYNSTSNKFEGYENGAWVDLIGGGNPNAIPEGSVMAYTSATPPTGWLVADGSAVSRTTYSDLFDVIGTTYGVGDGSTTFNLPNLSGRNIIGYGSATSTIDALGETGGEDQHLLTVSEMPSHTHDLNVNQSAAYDAGGPLQARKSGTTASGSAGGDQPHNILDPYIVLVYIIKY